MHKQDISARRVIVVDHDEATIELIAELLKSEGFSPLCCAAWLLSVDFIEQTQPKLIILDLSLGDATDALDLISELRRNPPTHALPVIVNSTNDRQLEQLADPLRELGCLVLAKPFELDDFFALIHGCLDSGCSHMQRLTC